MKLTHRVQQSISIGLAVLFGGVLLVASSRPAAAVTYSMWTNATVPSNPTDSDTAAVELGVKFRASVTGKVTGIKFYKGTGNGGTHTGNLWTRSGTKLATVKFTNETATGWQTAMFATPVTITANTTYVASYFAPQGHYAGDVNYFATSASTNGPLTFLKNGTDGGNGVYRYNSRSAFPNQTYASTNYYVDVLFDDNTAPGDTTPPTVSTVTPVNAATNIATNTTVTATFSEPMLASTVTNTSVTLQTSGGTPVAASVTYDSANRRATLTPNAALANSTQYNTTLTTALKDLAGNALAAPYTWTFTTAAPADTTPPTVSSVTPLSGATGVDVGSAVSAVFSEALNAATVTAGSFTIVDSLGTPVSGTVSYDAPTKTAALTPSSPLATGTNYTATLTTAITDAAGNAMAANYSWSFSTTASPATTVDPLAQGNGGPILVITNQAAPLNNYYSEILRAEGLNSFAAIDLADVTATVLSQYDVVVLGQMALTTSQVNLLTAWVNGGGNLIAMQPDKKLAGLLGLTDQTTTLAEGYLQVNTSVEPGFGITSQTMQYHGTADRYTANAGTQTVATLYSNATTATSNPAVSLRSVGTNGGQAAAFTYDLARSVTRTHQGNPDWAATNRDTDTTIRPDDLFYGGATADYVNLDKVAIPQADEQQRLLNNLVITMNKDRKPLAKFWYFPNGKKAVVVAAGDDHSGYGAGPVMDAQIAASPAGCSAADWECVRSTVLTYTDKSQFTEAQASSYVNQGFEIGLHVNPPREPGTTADYDCGSWTNGNVSWLGQQFDNDLAAWRAKYPNLPNQVTTRNHCAIWSDYTSSATVEAARGLRMDLNYYYYPGDWIQNRPGFFTGSGIPMRFMTADSSYIDVYQVPSHLVNENGLTYPAAINTVLDKALGAEGYYGAFGTHYDYRGDNFETNLLQSSQSRGVPMVSGKMLADWTDGRNASYITNQTRSGSTYSFTATVDSRARSMMRGMVPYTTPQGQLQTLTRGGAAISYSVETIKGIQYAFFTATSGNYVATYAPDTTAPTVVSVAPVNGATSVPTSINVVATFSESLDPSSVTTTSVQLRDSTNAVVPSNVTYDPNAKTVTIDPTSNLSSTSTYTVVINGGASNPVRDASGNALAATFTSTFTTATQQISLWAPSTPSYSVATNDTSDVELGLRFTTSQAGTISGLTFYKGFDDGLTHTLRLYDAAGTVIGTATTANETPTGWQTAYFATPVAVQTGTTYTATYRMPTGRYAFTYGSLSSDVTNAPLTALANGGVYRYGGGYPTDTFNGSNYWVDVIWTP